MKKISKILVFSIMVFCMIFGLTTFFVFEGKEKTVFLAESNSLENSLYGAETGGVVPSGSGTTNDPYVITIPEELAFLAKRVNLGQTLNNAILQADINLATKIWTPIGNEIYSYVDTFDGNGYKISNMTIDTTISNNYVGLFGRVSGYGKIQNLMLENAMISTNAKNVGMLIGQIDSSYYGASEENCVVSNVAVIDGFINYSGVGTAENNSSSIGGIVGKILNAGTPTIKNSFSSAVLSTPGEDSSYSQKTFTGGIVGQNFNTSLKIANGYFTGKISTNDAYNPIVYNAGGANFGTKFNLYYAYERGQFNGSAIVSSKISRYYSSSGIASTEMTFVDDLSPLIKNLNIFTYFNDTSSTDILKKIGANWVKVEGEYPLLRGVANRVIALKNANNYDDFSQNDSLYPVWAVQSLTQTSDLTLTLKVTAQDSTWQSLVLYRTLGGTNINLSTPVIQENTNRLVNEEKIVTVPNESRQGYYTFTVESSRLLHAQTIELKDRATNEKIDGLLSFLNVNGEVYLNTTSQNVGTKLIEGAWSYEIFYSKSSLPIKIYSTENTLVKVHAYVSGKDYYHSLELVTSLQTSTNTFMTNTQGDLVVVYLSDLFKINYNQSLLFENCYDYGERQFNANQIYLSYQTEEIYTYLNGAYQRLTPNPYQAPSAKGYIFDGWFDESKAIRFSSGMVNYYSTTQTSVQLSNAQLLQQLLTLQTYNDSGKIYKIANEVTVFSKWQEEKHDVEFGSLLNLQSTESQPNFWEVGWQVEQMQSAIENMYELGDSDVALKIQIEEQVYYGSSGEFNSINGLSLSTGQSIRISAQTEGVGYGLRAIVLMQKNALGIEAFSKAPATFALSYNPTDSSPSMWYKYYYFDEQTDPQDKYVEINHIHGDLIIFAIYDRGTGTINAVFNVKKPSGAETGFGFDYEIIDIDNSVVSGKIDEHNNVIYGIRAGEVVVFKNLTLNSNLFMFTNNLENRFEIKLNPDPLIEVVLKTPQYFGEEKWRVDKFIKVGTTFLTEEKTVEFDIFVRYKGLTFNIKQGYFNEQNEFESLPNLLLYDTEQFAVVNLSYFQGSVPVIVSNKIENVKADTSLILTVSNQKLWQMLSSNNIKVFVENSGQEILLNSPYNLTLTRQGENDYILSGFSGFDESVYYDLYLVMEKVVYNLEIEKQGSVSMLDVTYIGGGQLDFILNKTNLYLTFDQIISLQFKINKAGYKIDSLQCLNKNIEIDDNQTFDYDFALYQIDKTASQISADSPILMKVNVSPKDTQYKIEYYQEKANTNQEYELFEEEIVSLNVKTGDFVTISPFRKSYIGFSYLQNENEKLSGEISFHEEEMTVFAIYYARKIYTINYDGSSFTSGEGLPSQSVKYGESFISQENTFEKTGHTFLCWNKNINGTQTNYFENEQIIVNEQFIQSSQNEQITLYAIWQAKSVKINFSATDADQNSSLWKNKTDYIVSSTEKIASSFVTYGKTFGFVASTNYNTLIEPTKTGFDFAGWWTNQTDGQQILSSTIVEFENETTLYAKWTKQVINIEFRLNLTGVSVELFYENNLSPTKKLYYGDKFSFADVETGQKSGFPYDSWLSAQAYQLKGWCLEAKPSATTVYLTNQSVVETDANTVYVYAHWELKTPVLNTSNWVYNGIYNGKIVKTLEVGSNSNQIKYITNYSATSGIEYKYNWFLNGQEINQTGYALYLKDVSQSGMYQVEIYAKHATWGESSKVFETGQVNIEKAQINVFATKTLGLITKTFDGNTNVYAITSSNPNVVSVSAKYDTQYVGINKQVVFYVDFVADNPNNYNVVCDGTLIENLDNSYSLTHTTQNGQITKYNLSLEVDKTKIANGLNQKINADEVSINNQNKSFLVSLGLSLTGYIETNGATSGVYNASSLTMFLKVLTNEDVDITENFNFSLSGTVEITEGTLKTLVINKKAILNKDTEQTENISTLKYSIMFDYNDLTNSGVYNISGNYFNVQNDDNSQQIIISTDADFDLEIQIVSTSFVYNVGLLQTQAFVESWTEQGQNDIKQTWINYDFSQISVETPKILNAIYINYSTIIYKTQINEQNFSQTVYNTIEGIEISHIDEQEVAQTGLNFEGWFLNDDLAPTLWSGYGEIELLAKWTLNLPEIELLNDGEVTNGAISSVYDAKNHEIGFNITNQNAVINYIYTWKETGSTHAGLLHYYKDVQSKSIILSVNAQLYIDGNLKQSVTSQKQITINIEKFDFVYEQEIEKIFDGTNTIKSAYGNFEIIQIQIGQEIEFLKLFGEYSEKYAGQNIALTNLRIEDYLSYKASNFNLTISSFGKITPKILTNVDIGTYEQNEKVYDGLPLTLNKTKLSAVGLVESNVLDITLQTNSPEPKTYDAQANEITILSYSVFDGAIDISSSYILQNIIGTARIVKDIFSTDSVILTNAQFVYDGNQKYVKAVVGDELMGDLEINYTWYNVLFPSQIKTYEQEAPINVGEYVIVANIESESDFIIQGENPKTCSLIITARKATIYLPNLIYYGVGAHEIVLESNPDIIVSNLVLPQNHHVVGSVAVSSLTTGSFSQSLGNLNVEVEIYDGLGNLQTENYQIVIDGNIIVEHYYYLHFNANGAYGEIEDIKLDYLENIFLPANTFVYDGFEFAGWSQELNGEVVYTDRQVFNETTSHGETINLYAVWNPSQQTEFVVEYYLQNIDETYSNEPQREEKYTATTNNTLQLIPSLNGEVVEYFTLIEQNGETEVRNLRFEKAFEGFSAIIHSSNVLSGLVLPKSENTLVLKIYYQRNTYTLTLFKNNFDNPSQIEQTYKFGEEIIEPVKPQRQGYVFDGWFANYPNTNMYKIIWPLLMPAKNIELWAIYISDQNQPFTLNYYFQNQDNTYLTEPSITVNLTAPTDAYACIETALEDEQIISAVLRFYNNEEKEIQYGVDYEIDISSNGFFLKRNENDLFNGLVLQSPTLSLKLYYERQTFTLTKVLHNGQSDILSEYSYYSQITTPDKPQKQGYEFVGWFLDYDEIADTYSNPVTWPIEIVSNLTVHAKWQPKQNTQFTLNIFFELLTGGYSLIADKVFVLESATGYYAEFETVSDNNYVIVYYDVSKTLSFETFGTYNFDGFELDSNSSNLQTYVYYDESGVINVYFARKDYNITFEFNNGQASNSLQYKFNSQIDEIESPLKVGYTFNGWYLDDEFSEHVILPYTVTKDITMYAKWTDDLQNIFNLNIYLGENDNFELAYSEQFEANAGKYASVEEIDGMWTLNLYQDLSKTVLIKTIKSCEILGYTFTDKNQTLEKVVLIDNSTSIDLYFQINSYNFIIKQNNSLQDIIEVVKYKQKPILNEQPIKAGYNFAGYYTNEELTTQFLLSSFEMPSSDFVVYTKWEENKNTSFVVEYYLQSLLGTFAQTADEVEEFVTTTNNFVEIENDVINIYDSSLKTILIEQKALKDFVGFSKVTNANEILNGEVLLGYGLVLKVFKQRNEYSITIDYKDGVTPNKTFTNIKFEQFVQENIPQRAGYNFVGLFYKNAQEIKADWQINQQFGTMTYQMQGENVEFIAKWTTQTDVLYFANYYIKNLQDENYSLLESKELYSITGQTVQMQILSFAGYIFESANINNVLSGVVDAASPLILSAYYIRQTYVLSFESLLESTTSTLDMEFLFEQTKALNLNEFEVDGFNFLGWAENIADDSIKYLDGDLFTFNFNEDKTLYAVWQLKSPTDVSLQSSEIGNCFIYGDSLILSVLALHDVTVEYFYEWFFNDEKIINTLNNYEVLNFSQSGNYYANVWARKIIDGIIYESTPVQTNTINVEVLNRKITVTFSENTFVYNGQNQMPIFEINYFLDETHFLPTRTEFNLPNITYILQKDEVNILQSVNVGIYHLEILLIDFGFVFEGENTFDFEIEKLLWDISSQIEVGEFSKEFSTPNLPDPILQKELFCELTGESILVQFSREQGEEVETYNLFVNLTNPEIENYNIVLQSENKGFIITKFTSSNESLYFLDEQLLTKVYDGEDIDLSGNAFMITNLYLSNGGEITSAEFEIIENNDNVGNYEIVLKKALSTQVENIVLGQSYYFSITKRQLEYQPTIIEKYYDKTTIFEFINAQNILPKDNGLVYVVGNYQSAFVGENIPVGAYLIGSAKENYSLSYEFDSLVGKIIKMPIKVISQSGLVFEYGDDIQLDFEAFGYNIKSGEFDLVIDKTELQGNIQINSVSKVIVGIYQTIVGSLASENYEIDEFVTENVEVVAKNIQAIADWQKYYDGNSNFDREITLVGVIEGDDVYAIATFENAEVGNDKLLTILIYGTDADNYVLQNTTATGKIEYEVKYVTAIFDYNFDELSTLNHSQITETSYNLIYYNTIKESGFASLPIPFADGYNFVGWFDSETGGNEFTKDTLISPANWQEDLTEKTLYARWEMGNVTLTIGVITENNTNYIVEDMQNFVGTSGSVLIDGGNILYGTNTKEIAFLNWTTLVALANTNYEFVGWFLSAMIGEEKIESNEEFILNGNDLEILMQRNITIYAKFKLQTAKLTLNLNSTNDIVTIEGELTDWNIIYENGKVAKIWKEFDMYSNAQLPQNDILTRNGYNLTGYFTSSTFNTGDIAFFEYELNNTDTELFAIWGPNTYQATFVASTGNENESLLNADKGGFESVIDTDSDGIISKDVSYNLPMGEIPTPTRLRYIFDGWFDNENLQGIRYDENSIYTFTENMTFYAKWADDSFNFSINVTQTNGGNVFVEESSGILSVLKQTIENSQSINVTALFSTEVHIIIEKNIGYIAFYESEYIEGVDFTLTSVENTNTIDLYFSRYCADISINIIFKSILNQIEIVVLDSSTGTIETNVADILANELRASETNDNERVQDISGENEQRLIINSFSGESIEIIINEKLGYVLSGLLLNEGNGEFLNDNGLIKFYNFSKDGQIYIEFSPSTNQIEVEIKKDILNNYEGSFKIGIIDEFGDETIVEDNAFENNTYSQISIKTNETLVMYLTANFGYLISQNQADYIFVPNNVLAQNPTFDLAQIDSGKVLLSQFNSGGQIVLPFIKQLFEININYVLFDEGEFYLIEENTSTYASVQFNTPYDQAEKYYYLNEISLSCTVEYGYDFVGWLTQADIEDIFSSQNSINFLVENNSTIYVAIELTTHTITYVETENGYINAESLVFEIKHQSDSEVVVAIADEGYRFDSWEIFDQSTQSWQTDTENTQTSRYESEVTQDLTIRAKFVGEDVLVDITSTYILEKDEYGDIVYGNDMSEDIGFMQIFDTEEKGTNFVYSSTVGQNIRILAISKAGYKIVGWNVNASGVQIQNNGQNYEDITIFGYKADFTLLAIFETNENQFEIVSAIMQGNEFLTEPQFYEDGAIIEIEPNNFSQTSQNATKAIVKARTKQEFVVTYNILQGYNLVFDEISQVAKVGILYEDSDELVFATNVQVIELTGIYKQTISFTISNFVNGGKIVLFLTKEIYEVVFYKTQTESRIFNLTINSVFGEIDQEYLIPSQMGYIFEGWFSQQGGQGINYIDKDGQPLYQWNIEHRNIYALWSKAFVRYTLIFVPSISITQGPIGWNVKNDELKQVINTSTYEYYVGIETYFEAPQGIVGYKFDRWEKDETIVSYNERYFFEIDEDETQFEQSLYVYYSVKTVATATAGGVATIDNQQYVYLLMGQSAILRAEAQIGFEFIGWTIQGETQILSTDIIWEVSYQSSLTVYVANFAGKKVEIKIEVGTNGQVTSWKINNQDVIEENGKYYARFGDVLTFSTQATIGYTLSGWLVNGENTPKFDEFLIDFEDIETLVFVFKPQFSLIEINYEIKFVSAEVWINDKSIDSGKVLSTDYYNNISFVLKPTIRYDFSYITVNGIRISSTYIIPNGDKYIVNIPSNILSLSVLNKIQLYFNMLYWLDIRSEFVGDGTAQNPYLITSPENFAQMAFLINNDIPVGIINKVDYASAYYLLSGSIDFENRFWVPIGTEQSPFDGVIFINYTIRNIYLDRNYSVTKLDGLFGVVTDRAQFILGQKDVTTGILIFTGFGVALISIASFFAIRTYRKRKRLIEQSSLFPTERPIKK